MYKIMTAGPVQVRDNVLLASAKQATNPDLDHSFFQFYKELTDDLNGYVNNDGCCYILGGEGILGLEAAIASLTEPGDNVLIIDNGVFGKGFGDFVSMYQGTPHYYKRDYHKAISPEDLDEFITSWEKQGKAPFKYATLVHCDTPTAMLNPIEQICNVLHSHHIMTVVDAVSSLFACPVNMKTSYIDILCGGSQKALSAPSGLSMVWLSKDALNAIENRKKPIQSFYANLSVFKDYYEKKWFPYTMPIHQINGLRVAFDNVLDNPNFQLNHEKIAYATRVACINCGLSLWGSDGFSPTVTAIKVPNGISDKDVFDLMEKEHNIMLSGGFDSVAGQVIRIGHMGENAKEGLVFETLLALDDVLQKLGVGLEDSLAISFAKALQEL